MRGVGEPPEWLHDAAPGRFVPLARPLLADSFSSLDFGPAGHGPAALQTALCTLLLDWRALIALLVACTIALAARQTSELCGADESTWADCASSPVLVSAVGFFFVCIAACHTRLDGRGDWAASRLFCAVVVSAPCYQCVTVRCSVAAAYPVGAPSTEKTPTPTRDQSNMRVDRARRVPPHERPSARTQSTPASTRYRLGD